MINEALINVDEFISQIRATKPPFSCPFSACNKICKSFSAIEKHLILFHNNSNEIEICEIDAVNNQNKNSHELRENNSLLETNIKQTSKLISDVTQLSYADSKKFVILQNERRSFRCNVNVPIYVSMLSADLNKIVANTFCVENSQSKLSNCLKKNGKKRKLLPIKSIRKFRKLNNEEKNSYNNVDESNINFLKSELVPVAKFTTDNSLVSFKKHIPDRNTLYIQHVEKSLDELNESIEYDLDEEDMFWLPRCNDYLLSLDKSINKIKKNRESPSKFKRPLIERKVMEYVMNKFEKECHFVSKTGSNFNIDVDEDAICDVCLDGTCDNSNVILFCDVCNLAVHQECYGVPYIPEGQWLCRKCFHSPSHPVDCCLCPNKGGAFKQTDDSRWAHVVCGLWIPEVVFANLIFLEPIENIEKIESARWRLLCYLCKQKNGGACIQCHKSNCYVAFHVTCAQQAGLYMKIEHNDRSNSFTGIKKSAFCDMHTPFGYVGAVHRGMYAHSDDEMAPEKSFKRQTKLKNVRKLLTQRRSINAPICYPVIPEEKLNEICSKIDIKYKEEFISRIHAYWKLKRECKRGVPLLRRLVASSSKASLMQFDEGNKEMMSNLKFWQQLRQDLEKARLLSELGKKREKLKRDIFRKTVAINDVLLHPTSYLLKSLIDKLQALDKGKIFSEPVTDAMAPGYSRVIKKAMDFSLMRKKFISQEYINIENVYEDFELMLNNCLRYNDKKTIYFHAAQRLQIQSKTIFDEFKQKYIDFGINRQSGLFINQNIYGVIMNDLDDINIINKLEAEINRNVEEPVLKSLKTEENTHCKLPITFLEPKFSQQDNSYPIKTRRQSQESLNSRQLSTKTTYTPVSKEDFVENKESRKLIKMPATSSIDINTISSSTRTRSSSRIEYKKSICGNVTNSYADPDSTDDIKMKTQFKQRFPFDVKCEDILLDDNDSCTYTSNNTVNTFVQFDDCETITSSLKVEDTPKPLEFVWAKFKGFQWFPGMIIDPSNIYHNANNVTVTIPLPPDRVLQLQRLQNFQSKYLILFFDKNRTWQWLEKEKFKPFAIIEKVDRDMFQIIQMSKRNKTILLAYKEAVHFICKMNDLHYPYEDDESVNDVTSPFIIPKFKR